MAAEDSGVIYDNFNNTDIIKKLQAKVQLHGRKNRN